MTEYPNGSLVIDTDPTDQTNDDVMVVVSQSAETADEYELWEEPSGKTTTVAEYNDCPADDPVVECAYVDSIRVYADNTDLAADETLEAMQEGGEWTDGVPLYGYPISRIETAPSEAT